MKKISDILFIKRIETENKWWHRLANVLILGSSVLLLVSMIYLNVLDFKESNSKVLNNIIPTTTLTLEKIQKFDNVWGSKTTAQLEDGSYVIQGKHMSFVEAIPHIASETTKELSARKKINNTELIKDILITIIIVLGWLFFCYLVVYKTIIYIIFGKKK